MRLSLNENGPLAILLDDHKLFTDTFARTLETTRLFSHVFSFYDEREVLEFVFKEKLTNEIVFFMEYYINNKTTLNLLKDIRRIKPKSRAIIISSITNPLLIKDLMRYKPHGVISKYSSFDEIIKCLYFAGKTKLYLCPVIQKLLNDTSADQALSLTSREIDIIRRFATGESAAEVAQSLSLSPHTIATHRKNIFKKMRCNSITELLAIARNMGII